MPATIDSTPGAAMAPATTKVLDRGNAVASFDLADHPMPTGREEEWRFIPLRRLLGLLEDTPSAAHLDWDTDLPVGVEVSELDADQARLRTVKAPADRAAALAVANSGGAMLIRVADGVAPDGPAVIRLHGRGMDEVVWGHVIIEAGANSQLTVVLEHTGSARYSSQVSIRLGNGANVEFVSLQQWDDDAVHLGHHAAEIGRDARLQSFAVTLGGSTVRLTQTVNYVGPGGEAQLLGAFFTDAGQHLEHRLFIDHSVPHCTSNVDYRGALQGTPNAGPAGLAHSVWIGDVLIRSGAVGTSTYEMNRNLVLTDNARADSVPNLEIETGEIIGAGHASTTGRFDDEQLFYLQSRGIPVQEARRLVVRGFFAEIVGRIGAPGVAEQVLHALDAELGSSDELFDSLRLDAGADHEVMA